MRRVAVIDIGTVTARLGRRRRRGRARRSSCEELHHLQSRRGCCRDRASRPGGDGACLRMRGRLCGVCRAAGAEVVACTLTSAARDASNSPDLGQALASLGLEPLVIPGEIEGALTFLGVAQDFLGQRILVADNGGGSTELACGTLDGSMLDLTFVRSTNVGCRRLTELFLSRTDPPSTADVAEAHAFAARLFSSVVSRGRPALWRQGGSCHARGHGRYVDESRGHPRRAGTLRCKPCSSGHALCG